MTEIITFRNKKSKEKNTPKDSFVAAQAEFQEAAKRLEESQGEEALQEFLSAMGELAREALRGQDLQEIVSREQKWYADFLRRNREIIDNEPKFDAGARMQYYAGKMLDLIYKIFHTEDGFSEPFDDFSYFFTECFDVAFSKYSKRYADLEEEYHFTEELTFDAAVLEKGITDCLNEVVCLKPNECDEDKTRLLYCGSRVFELYRNLLYYWTDEDKKK